MTDEPAPPEVVSTRAAAHTLGLRRQTLTEWADAGFLTPTAIDDEGHRRWDLADLRRQLLAHIDERQP